MQIQDFEYLLAVAEHGGIGRAADVVGLSQPALTKAIRRIEQQAGLPLFIRHAKGMRPTEAGQAFLRRGRQIWLEYEDAQREMEHMRNGQLGRLRVGFSPSVAGDMLVSALRQLIIERPAAQLHLRERLASGLVEMLLAGELDLILAPATEVTQRSELSFQPLYRDQLRVVCDADHPLRRRRALALMDVAHAQWVLPSRSVFARQRIEEEFARNGLASPAVRVEAEFGHVSMWPLVSGSGLLSICSGSHLAEARQHGLEVLALKALQIEREIGVLVRGGAWQSPLVQRLTQLLAERTAGPALHATTSSRMRHQFEV